MDEPSQKPTVNNASAFDYRHELMRKLHQRWTNLSHEWDQLAASDWDGTRQRRMVLEYRMAELNHVMQHFMPWIDPPFPGVYEPKSNRSEGDRDR